MLVMTRQQEMLAAAHSQRGGGHIRNGSECQDRHAFHIEGPNWYLVCCDGAGSAPHSGEGAEMSVRTAMRWLAKNRISRADAHPERLLAKCFQSVHRRLCRFVDSQQESLSDFCTTLLVVVGNEHGLVAGLVGDGGLVLRKSSGEGTTLMRDNRPGPANVSAFITDEDFLGSLQICRYPARKDSTPASIDGVVGFTDGIESLVINRRDGKANRTLIDALIDNLQSKGSKRAKKELISLLSSEPMRKYSDDDITVVVLARGAQHA